MTRLAHLALAALLVSGTATAQAAPPKKKPPRQVCNLVTDDSGDGHSMLLSLSNAGPILKSIVPSSDALDILIGDVATGTKTIKATMTMKGLEKDAWTTYEILYRVSFSVGSTPYKFELTQEMNSPGQATFSQGSSRSDPAAFSVDQPKKTIIFTAPRSLAKALKPGSKIDQLSYVTEALGANADQASDNKVFYVDRTPSCLKPV